MRIMSRGKEATRISETSSRIQRLEHKTHDREVQLWGDFGIYNGRYECKECEMEVLSLYEDAAIDWLKDYERHLDEL